MTESRVEDLGGIFTLRQGGITRAWNGIQYKTGLAARNTTAKKLSMNVATVPPGACAYAHIHVDFEVMLYILAGRVRHLLIPEHPEPEQDDPEHEQKEDGVHERGLGEDRSRARFPPVEQHG